MDRDAPKIASPVQYVAKNGDVLAAIVIAVHPQVDQDAVDVVVFTPGGGRYSVNGIGRMGTAASERQGHGWRWLQ